MRRSPAPDLLQKIWGNGDRCPKLSLQRICHAEETFARIEPLLASAGITRIADVTGLDRLRIPVAIVARPNSRALSVSQGKGLSLAAAKVSGAMEALESFHAERVDRPIFLQRWSELAGTGRATDPCGLPQLRSSRFHSEKRIPWIAALDLVSGSERLIPFELVHTDFTIPALPGTGCFPRSSNGLASGNSFAEAALHGLCELVERDSYALYMRHSERGTRVDLATISDPVLLSLLDRIEAAGCTLSIRDITSDLDVPVFWAVISGGGESASTAAPSGGLGCHPDRVWACVRAITEAAQSRATRLSGSRDDLTRKWFQTAQERVDVPAAERMTAHGFGPGFRSETVEEDLHWLLHQLAANGLDSVLAVDLSRAEFGLPVVRIVVPGLEHPGDDVVPGQRALPS